MAVMTASGVATPRGVAKPRTKNMKAQFNDWAFFIGSKSPRILRAIKAKSLFRDVRQR